MTPEKPKRIQLSRKKGWRLPPNAVKVDRATRWGNSYVVGSDAAPTAADAVRHYAESISPEFERYIITNLRGKDLACWCSLEDEHCHANVLLRIANEGP
jgi:hypothetical protein